MNSLFLFAIHVSVLILLPRVKCITISSVAWSPIKVPLPADSSAISGKTVLEASKNCISLENCKAICLNETEIVMTGEVLDPNLCYDETEEVVQCWTSEKSKIVFIRFKRTRNKLLLTHKIKIDEDILICRFKSS